MIVDFLEEKYKTGAVFHDFINKILSLKTFDVKLNIPHEWYFIKTLNDAIGKNNNLAEVFAMYIAQYYPSYEWFIFNPNDYLGTVVLECGIQQYVFQHIYEFEIPEDNPKFLKQAMIFGEIATDFLIRYYGYSLIKCSGQKIILTAHSDCHKRFEELLSKGYSLQRKKKAGYIQLSNCPILSEQYPNLKGIFYKLPVLPTKDIGYPIDEIIEIDNDKYEKVLHL